MWLAARLDGIRAVGAKCIPEDKRVIVGAACKELVDFGVMNGVIKVGDSLPPHMGSAADTSSPSRTTPAAT